MLIPFCCLRPWTLGGQFVNRTSVGVFQYVLIRTLLSIVAFIAVLCDVYGEGEWTHLGKLYIYVTVTLNISQLWAMYCLVMVRLCAVCASHSKGQHRRAAGLAVGCDGKRCDMPRQCYARCSQFYHELKDELRPLRPFGKFIVVKVRRRLFDTMRDCSSIVAVKLLATSLTLAYHSSESDDDPRTCAANAECCVLLILAGSHHLHSIRDRRGREQHRHLFDG